MKVLIIAILISTILVAGCVQEDAGEDAYDPEDEANRLTGECYETVPDNTGHIHSWCGGAYYTEDYRSPEGVYHRHALDEENNLALESNGHTHRLR
jgi:hypothetical protein